MVGHFMTDKTSGLLCAKLGTLHAGSQGILVSCVGVTLHVTNKEVRGIQSAKEGWKRETPALSYLDITDDGFFFNEGNNKLDSFCVYLYLGVRSTYSKKYLKCDK